MAKNSGRYGRSSLLESVVVVAAMLATGCLPQYLLSLAVTVVMVAAIAVAMTKELK